MNRGQRRVFVGQKILHLALQHIESTPHSLLRAMHLGDALGEVIVGKFLGLRVVFETFR